MTVTVELPPQIEQAYLAFAKANGVSVDAVVREVVIAGRPALPVQMTPAEWEQAFEQWADGLGESPANADPTSRESMYPDRW